MLQRFSHFTPLAPSKFIQDKALRVVHRMLRLNSDPQSHKFVGPQRADNRLQTVVPAGGAPRTQANAAKRQSQIVADHNQRLSYVIHFVLRRQTRNRFATQIHESLWLGEAVACLTAKYEVNDV